MEPDQTIRSLAMLRMAVGTSAWATPRLAGKAFGLDAEGNPQSPYLARLWLTLGVVCDAADAAAGVLAGRGGYLPKPATVMVTGVALVAAGLGLAALANSEA